MQSHKAMFNTIKTGELKNLKSLSKEPKKTIVKVLQAKVASILATELENSIFILSRNPLGLYSFVTINRAALQGYLYVIKRQLKQYS